MHKHFSARVVSAVAIFLIAALAINRAGADNSLPWINSPLSMQKQTDALSVPLSLNGNIDCYPENSNNCSVPTGYGVGTQNSSVRLNGDPNFRPVISYVDNRQHFLPIPNSSTAITYTTEPVFGFNLNFNYNFLSTIKAIAPFGATEYQMVTPPDGKLADKSNHPLVGDYTSMSFSENGQWMVVSDPNVTMLRVNLQTFEVLPFAPSFNYAVGLDPAVKTAITNDGRYAVVASANFNVFKIYDLSTCGSVPDTINGPVSCQSRDLQSYMKLQVPTYASTSYIRFMDDDTLAAYSTYKSGTANKTSRFIISDSAISSQIQYLALGDSYVSGEGAFDYQGGTDTSANKCHVSLLAYPALIGRDLSYNSYHSVACSGAIAQDITDVSIPNSSKLSQVKDKELPSFDNEIYVNFEPGYRAQINFVTKYQPKIINLSVGGNDMGFSGILQQCVEPQNGNTCYNTYEDRFELVNQINNTVYPRLVQTYQKIKNGGPPDMRIYVIGYPQIAKPGGNCGLNVHLNSDEILFSQNLIGYLDSVVQTAAAKTGVYYVDTQDALNGHRLCEAGPGSIAMNGLTAGNDRPDKFGGPIGDESYHPNDFGYQLLENKILAATKNLTEPMPTANSSVSLPSINGLDLLNVPHIGRVINTAEFDPDLSPDLVFQQTPASVLVNDDEHSLAPGTVLQAEIHSDPVKLGAYTTDNTGNLSSQITVPSSVPAGYHTLHFYGKDINSQSVDIYKYIYVAKTADDLDGDGIIDGGQSCIGFAASGQDADKDGIDDSCDPNITAPPVPAPTTSNSAPSSNSSASSDSDVDNSEQSQSSMTVDLSTSIEPSVPEPAQIFVASSDSTGSVAPAPSVLGLAKTKPQAKILDSSEDSTNNKYFLPGFLTMLSGTIGLLFKRCLF